MERPAVAGVIHPLRLPVGKGHVAPHAIDQHAIAQFLNGPDFFRGAGDQDLKL